MLHKLTFTIRIHGFEWRIVGIIKELTLPVKFDL